jgi:hypothetical protein
VVNLAFLTKIRQEFFERMNEMKGRRLWLGVLVVALVGVVVVVADAAQKVQYGLKLEKGKKYYVKMITDQQITQTMMGQEQNMEQTIGMGMDFDVNDVNDRGDAWVRFTYRWMKFRQKGPMNEIVYDSSQKDVNAPPAAQGFAALLNEGFAVKLTPQGKAVQVKGLDKMRNNISQKLPTGPMREYMLKGMEQFLSEEAMKEFTESSFAMYPDREVGVGDSWTKMVSMTRGLPMTIANKCSLKDRKDGVAILDVSSEIKTNPNAKPMEMGLTKMTYELTGTQQGQVRIDETTGLMRTSSFEQQISGQVKMAMPAPTQAQKPDQNQPQSPTEMVIPMKIKSTVTTEMTERK